MFEKLKAKREATQAQKEAEKIDAERDARCIPLAKEFLRLITDANVSLDPLTEDSYAKEYNPIVEKILERCLEENLQTKDLDYIKQLILSILQNVNTLVISSVNNSLRIAEKALWGCNKDEMTLGRLDEVLKGWTTQEEFRKLVDK